MKRILSLLLAAALTLSMTSCAKEKQKFSAHYFDWFDTVTSITGYEYTQADFDKVCDELETLLTEYHRLYDIYTLYDGVNNLAYVNRAKGETVAVDGKIIDLVELSRELNNQTQGKVNVAMGSVLKLWHDARTWGISTPEDAFLPDYDKLLEANEHTDFSLVVTDREAGTITLNDPQLSLDVGAIAKGYATEMAAEYLESLGRTGYVLNVGGNVRTVGTKPDGSKWLVGIENPDTDSDEPYIAYLELAGESLVTSGSYQRFYYVDGKSYHHIIDPDTLYPGERYLSVSVVCDDSGLADGYSTALFNMDLEEALKLVNSTEGLEAMWVKPNGERVFSDGFEGYIKKE